MIDYPREIAELIDGYTEDEISKIIVNFSISTIMKLQRAVKLQDKEKIIEILSGTTL